MASFQEELSDDLCNYIYIFFNGALSLLGTRIRRDVTVTEEVQVGQVRTALGDAVQIIVADDSSGR